jgi:hypothetical protein
MSKKLAITIRISATAMAAVLSGCMSTYQQGAPMGDVSDAFADMSIDPGRSYSQSGVVEYVWEEPMVDVIDVPPGLDAEGVYYRPAHREVVEIRQGRWQYYKQRR